MLRLITLLIFLMGSVWLGLVIVNHPGYVFIASQPWQIQMPLWFAALSLIFILGLFYLIIDSMDRLEFWWFRIKNWMRIRREHRSYNKTQHGLSLLIEGRWAKAERLLLKGSDQGVEPLMNYLGAARAAQEQNALDRRDRYLRKAHQLAPDAELAIGLTQAELELEQNQTEQAVMTLNRLRGISKRHPRVLQLLERAYVRLADWSGLRDLLPEFRKAKVLNAEQAAQFEKYVYCEMLKTAGTKDRAELQKLWDDMPRAMRKQPEVVLAYVQQLLLFGDQAEIEQLIQKVLKYEWQPELMKIYSGLSFDNLNRQLVIAGAWLKIYGPKPEILLFLGKTCMQIQLWGKAKDYLERCLAEGSNPEAALKYGELLERLGNHSGAVESYRAALAEMG